MDDLKRQELADKIEAAFKQAPYPGDDHIGIGFPDGKDVEADFKGKHWRDLPLDLIILHRDKMPSLTAEAFRFYLPAYFLAALWHFDKVDTLLDNLLFNVSYG